MLISEEGCRIVAGRGDARPPSTRGASGASSAMSPAGRGRAAAVAGAAPAAAAGWARAPATPPSPSASPRRSRSPRSRSTLSPRRTPCSKDDYTRITHPSRALFRATINKKPERNEGAAACARPPRPPRAIGPPPLQLSVDWVPMLPRSLRLFFRCVALQTREETFLFLLGVVCVGRVASETQGCIDKNVTGNQYEPRCRRGRLAYSVL